MYGVRGDDYLTFCENRMSKKILVLEIWAQNGPKRARRVTAGTLFQTLTKNGSKDFCNFWYGARGDDYLTCCENRMSKKILVLEIWAQNGPKRARRVTAGTLFQTLTKNGSKDFSDFGPELVKFWVLGNDLCQLAS